MSTTVFIFITTKVGVALGRIPGLTLDRTGIALLGAIAMIVAGGMSFHEAVDAVDLPTIVLLYALMVGIPVTLVSLALLAAWIGI